MREAAPPEVRDAAELLVRDLGIEAAERDLQQRIDEYHDARADRAKAALAALRRGEVDVDE